MVVLIALDSACGQLFKEPLLGYEAEKGDLWRHSLAAAVAARELSRLSRREVAPDLAFTAGVLHDIGKVVLSDHLKGTARELLDAIDQELAENYLVAERRKLGMDHCQVGSLLARRWRLPEALIQAIALHHDPASAPDEHKPLVYVVHMADVVAMLSGSGSGADALKYGLAEDYEDYVAMTEADLERILLQVWEELKTLEAVFPA